MTTPSQYPDSDSDSATLRTSDAEREAVATRLRAAVGTGHLTVTEADERQAAAYAATTRAELVPLTADLPAEPVAAPPPRRRRGPLADDARRGLAIHAAVVGFLAVFLVTRWALDPAPVFWPVFPMFWLGLSLVLHHRWASRAVPRTGPTAAA